MKRIVLIFALQISVMTLFAQHYAQWGEQSLEFELAKKPGEKIEDGNRLFLSNPDFKIVGTHFELDISGTKHSDFLYKVASHIAYSKEYSKSTLNNDDYYIEYINIGLYNKLVAVLSDIVQPKSVFVVSIDYNQGYEEEARAVLSSCRKILLKDIEGLVINSEYNRTRNQKRVWDFLTQYSFDGFYLLQQYYALPNQAQAGFSRINLGQPVNFADYIKGNKDKDIVRALETIVHEINHAYTYKKGIIDGVAQEGLIDDLAKFTSFYLGNGKDVLVIRGKTFTSKELHAGFPEQGKSLRYDTYINTDNEIMMTQQSGIYGLLDEYNAYYLSTRLALELFPYYEAQADADVHAWHDFLQHFYGSFNAYAEFKLYMLHYLWYAKKNHPDVYNDLKSNKNFMLVLSTVDKNWVRTLNDFEVLKQKMIKDIQLKHSNFQEDEEYSYINRKGAGNFIGEFNRLVYVSQNPMYKDIFETFNLYKLKNIEMHK